MVKITYHLTVIINCNYDGAIEDKLKELGIEIVSKLRRDERFGYYVYATIDQVHILTEWLKNDFEDEAELNF